MSALQVLEENYVSLVTSLPMDDAIFLAKIRSKGLLPGDIKATLKSLPTPAKQATEFLDQVIEPSLKNEDIIPLKKLAKTIRSALDCGPSSTGNDKSKQESDL